MITSFRVQNFKILRDVTIQPSSLNVVIGSNGCGKSSLLQSMDFLRAFFMSSVEVYLQARGWNYRDIPNIQAGSRTIQWELDAILDADSEGKCGGLYNYSISISPRRYLAIGKEQLTYKGPDGEVIPLLRRNGRAVVVLDRFKGESTRFLIPNLPASAISAFPSRKGKEPYPEMRHFARWVRRFRYFSILDPQTLRERDRGEYSFIGSSGEHLAPILANFKKRKPDEFRHLVSRLRHLFPALDDLSFSGEGWGWRSIRASESRGARNFTLSSQQVSDGLLRVLAIASFLYLDTVPTVILLEEPENGVHPQLLRELAQMLRELTLRKPPNKMQVFFSTHSPYVLDEFYDNPEQVWIMEGSGPKGRAQISRLSEKSQIERLKNSFGSLGEAWFSNVLGGNPDLPLFRR